MDLDFFLCGRLLIAALTSDLVIGLNFQLLPGLVLGGSKCPGIYQFLPDLLVYELFVVISDGSLYLCGISGDILFITVHCSF